MDDLQPSLELQQAIALRVVEEVRQRQIQLTATYRLQLHPEFTFRDAAALVPYLHDLGVTHVYCSPYLRARRGSTHGYDICEHSCLNPELGGDQGFQEFVAALEAHGMGQILDIVPNHMAATVENPWWHDVLENGPVSPFAHFFDIDWRPVKQELNNKVLLPMLGQQYGEVLETGQLRLEYDEGAFQVRYYNHTLPLGPKTAIPILRHRLAELRDEMGESDPELVELESVITALEHLPPQSARDPAAIRERQREKEVTKRRLRELVSVSSRIRRHIEQNLLDYNGDRERPESFDLMDQLLDAQAYRLCQWRAASDEINYRRFFDINELAAICMESPDVFFATHVLVRRLIDMRVVHGVRIDHIDGLYDPEQYLWRLQWSRLTDIGARCYESQVRAAEPHHEAPPGGDSTTESVPKWSQLAPDVLRLCCEQLRMRQPTQEDLAAVLGDQLPEDLPRWSTETRDQQVPICANPPLFVVVEKILGPEEPLPEKWPVAGTTGYDFLNLLNGLFVVPQGLAEIVRSYDRFLGETVDFRAVEYDSKLLILRVAMSSELQMLAHRLNRISEQHRRSRDFTLNTLRLALREVLACFPAYRAYPGREGITDRDRKFVDVAVAKARRRNPAYDRSVFEFLRDVLLLQHPPGLSPREIREREVFTGKFQQVTSPAMAKGVEDTAFYVYVPLASINEVGSDPLSAPVSVADFHEANRQRNLRYPRAMLTTSTHDTKRSEDVRARLNVLSEVPREWRDAVNRFGRSNRRWRQEVDGEPAPSRNDEYLFYQAAVGIWPCEPPDGNGRAMLVERLQHYMEKATREAKQRTSWINPNQSYDSAMRDFIGYTMREAVNNRFLQDLAAFHAKVVDAGQYNALFQVVLKLLSPGCADIYQGEEIWDFSLVDPDNRRPVNFDLRRQLLDEIKSWEQLPEDIRSSCVSQLGRSPRDSRLKLYVTHKLLTLRRDLPQLFSHGRYLPLATSGVLAQHLVAFAWVDPEREQPTVVVAVPRQVCSLLVPASDGIRVLPEATAWEDTAIELPAGEMVSAHSVFTNRECVFSSPHLPVGELLHEFPVIVLRAK